MTKVKIPKRIAGVKVPKKVRRKAKKVEKVIKAVESPAVRQLAAAALGAVADARVRRRPRPFVHREGVGRTVAVDAEQLADTIRHAALDGLRAFFEGFDEGMRDLAGRRAAENEDDDEAVAAARAKPAKARRKSGSGS
jgi:hypothetical protein